MGASAGATGDARRRRRGIALALGLGLLAVGLVATLSQGAKRRAGTNDIPAAVFFGTAAPGHRVCQDSERIPRGTAAVRVSVAGAWALPARLSVALADEAGGHAQGGRGARWDGRTAVIVPLRGTVPADWRGDACIGVPSNGTPLYLTGTEMYPEEGARDGTVALPGRVHLEYLLAGSKSWWSSAPAIARRMDLGRAWREPPAALLIGLLMLTSIGLAAWQLLRGD